MPRPPRHGPDAFTRPISWQDYRWYTLILPSLIGVGAGVGGLVLGAIIGALSKGCGP